MAKRTARLSTTSPQTTQRARRKRATHDADQLEHFAINISDDETGMDLVRMDAARLQGLVFLALAARKRRAEQQQLRGSAVNLELLMALEILGFDCDLLSSIAAEGHERELRARGE